MKITAKSDEMYMELDWKDVEELKDDFTISGRYDGEHKVNLSIIQEGKNEIWTLSEAIPPKSLFDSHLHDYFISISIVDLRNQFLSKMVLKLCKNPHFTTCSIVFP